MPLSLSLFKSRYPRYIIKLLLLIYTLGKIAFTENINCTVWTSLTFNFVDQLLTNNTSMKSVVTLLLLLTTCVYSGENKRFKGKGDKNKPSSFSPTDDDLCDCYAIDLMEPPSNNMNETCYNYKIEKISNEHYCKPIEYMLLSTGDLTNGIKRE